MKRMPRVLLAVAGVIAPLACSDSGTGPSEEPSTALLGVVPAHGAVGVSVGTTVVVTFDHPVASGMEAFAALHESALTGPIVEGSWVLSGDGMVLTFTPASALKPATTYVVHLGAGMTDVHGNHVSLGQHGPGLGGQWATQTMMSGGMGMGMGHTGQMMGQGWAHPTNGSFGMIFSFTTAG